MLQKPNVTQPDAAPRNTSPAKPAPRSSPRPPRPKTRFERTKSAFCRRRRRVPRELAARVDELARLPVADGAQVEAGQGLHCGRELKPVHIPTDPLVDVHATVVVSISSCRGVGRVVVAAARRRAHVGTVQTTSWSCRGDLFERASSRWSRDQTGAASNPARGAGLTGRTDRRCLAPIEAERLQRLARLRLRRRKDVRV